MAVCWPGPAESEADKATWQRYFAGDRSVEVSGRVNECRKSRTEAILAASEEELLSFSNPQVELPHPARLHDTVLCCSCGEKVMASRVVKEGSAVKCIPCARIEDS